MSHYCTGCGTAVAPRQRFCTSCGQALTGVVAWPVVSVVVLLLVITVVVTVLVVRGGSPPSAPPPAVPVVAPASVAVGRVPTPAAPSVAGAATSLSAVVAVDAGQVSALDGSWVAQISSKRVGLVADGITYDQASILEDFRRSSARFPQAVLFPSDRFATFTSSGFYVTAIAIRYPAAGQANAWCTRAGLPADACFAKHLSSAPVAGATVVHR